MVDNASILYLENDILYNTSNTAVLSNGNNLVNVIQHEMQNNVIFVTQDQLESLGLCLENDILVNNTPAIKVNKQNPILNSKRCILKKPVTQTNVKSRSVLKKQYQICDNPVQENVIEYVPVHIPQYEVPIPNILRIPKKKVVKQSPLIIKKPERIEQPPVIVPEVPNKIVYRILHPEELRLIDRKSEAKASVEVEPKPKGRPFKTKDYLMQEPEKKIITEKKLGNIEKKTEYKEEDLKDRIDDGVKLKAVRTRFGRVTKPPQHLQKESSSEIIDTNNEITEPPKKQMRLTFSTEDKNINNHPPQFVNQEPQTKSNQASDNLSKDTKIISSSETKEIELKSTIPLPKRRICSTKYKCKTCNKYYLGKVRMRKHLQNNPDHIVPKKYEPYNRLWLDLLERIRNVQRAEQVATFLGELSYVLQKVKILVPKALHPVLKKDEYNFGIVDSKISTTLGIPEGKYTLDIDILEDDTLVLNKNINKVNVKSETEVMNKNTEIIPNKNLNNFSLKTNILDNLNDITKCSEINILNSNSDSHLLHNIINNDSLHISNNTSQSNLLNMEALNHDLQCNNNSELMINSNSTPDILHNIIRNDDLHHISNDSTESNILSMETLSHNISKCDEFPEVSLLNSDSTDSNLIQDIIKSGTIEHLEDIKTNTTDNLISGIITNNSNLIENIIRNDTLDHINDNSVPNILDTSKIDRNKSIIDPSILDDQNATVNILDCNDRNSNVSDNAVQTSLLNLLDTGQVNFDTSESSHACDVDQLVHERLKSLTGELSTSNSNQNITLDLSMDMFSYHTS